MDKDLVNTNKQNGPLVLRNDEEGRQKLSRLLLISFDVLDTFGKEVEQLENINLAFQMYLEDYSYSEVEKAFKDYMRNHTVLPKPADIIKMINKNPSTKFYLTEEQMAARDRILERERKRELLLTQNKGTKNET